MAERTSHRGSSSLAEILVDESPDALVALSLDGRILFWSRGAETTFGYSADEAIGHSITDLIIPDDQHNEARDSLVQASQRGWALFESVRRRKDGSVVHVDVSMRRGNAPSGEPIVIVRKRDIDQLKRLRENRMSEARFRGLLEAVPDALVMVDRAGIIQLVNGRGEALFGWKREELLGKPIQVLVPARYRDTHPNFFTTYFPDLRDRPIGGRLELYALRKDGTEFPAEISLGPIETPDGTLVTAAIRDVTERKRDMEERNRRMQETNRLKSEFLANMSHELRTPLNAIIGFAALMHTGRVGQLSDAQHEYIGDILNSGRHLLQLINDVLDLAKIESGKIELRIETVDLTRLAGEVRDILRALAAEKRIQLKFEIDASLSPVSTDPRLLKQVLYNYVSNAIKFTLEEGKIAVRIAPEPDDCFRVEVEDTGVGIRPQDMVRLFVEFQQLDEGLAKKYPGTGLGLALTQRIVEALGGRVGATSDFGRGSTFWAVLPRKVSVNPGGATKG